MKMISPASKLIFKYLALPNGIGGRGGVQRFFLLSQNIPFAEQLYAKGDPWATEKDRLVVSGENPCGTVPVIVVENDGDDPVTLPQHIASSRFLATVFGCNSGDAYRDYVQDMVADEYQGFRDKWVSITFSASDEEKEIYRKDGLPKQLTKFDALYQQFKAHNTFLSVSQTTENPLWGDAAVFGLLRDHTLTGHMTLEDLKTYPYLYEMYEAYEAIPAIAEWIEAKKGEITAAKN